MLGKNMIKKKRLENLLLKKFNPCQLFKPLNLVDE